MFCSAYVVHNDMPMYCIPSVQPYRDLGRLFKDADDMLTTSLSEWLSETVAAQLLK